MRIKFKLDMRFIATLFVTFIFTSALYGQKELILKFTPDDFPQDISWEIQTQDYKSVVASGNLAGCLPNEECVVFQDTLEDRCYTLLIKDSNRDGISAPGGYELFFGNELMVETEVFEERVYHNFNCGKGEVCEKAVDVELPMPKIYAPNLKEYWFSFTVPQDGHYRINTCKELGDNFFGLDTKLWYYSECNRRIQTQGAEGADGYSDNAPEPDCPPGAGFNFVPMVQGEVIYVRHKPLVPNVNMPKNDSILITIQKQPTRLGCADPEACNYDPFVQVDNGSCIYESSCLPDLSLDEEELRRSIEVDTVFNNDPCFVEEGCLRGPGSREVIRFSTKIDNIGETDYVVGRPESEPDLFSRDNCHGHAHHLGYAEYLLYSGQGQPEPVGFKSGFCVLDLDCSENARLKKYKCNYMGISAGCSDIYDSHIDCQWIDITDIPDGQYTIIIRVNHFRLPDARGLQEKSYENNNGQACVTIDRSSGELVVTVDDVCPEYEDCLGVPGGDAVVDCNGECGGQAHFGDLDATGELEQGDLDMYLDLLSNKGQLSGPCGDVNGDGKLSIYDAALVQECLQEKLDNAGNPFHTHCTFPAGNDLTDQVGMLRVTDLNTWEKYIDVEYWVNDKDVIAYQLSTSGIQISDVESYVSESPDAFTFNDESIYAMHAAEPIARNTGFQPFMRIFYESVNSDSLCITLDSEFINRDYNRISVAIENACGGISSTSDIIARDEISMIPNPAVSNVAIYANGKFVKSVEIFDVDGKSVSQKVIDSSEGFEMDIASLEEGLYVVQLNFSNGKIATKRLMKTE